MPLTHAKFSSITCISYIGIKKTQHLLIAMTLISTTQSPKELNYAPALLHRHVLQNYTHIIRPLQTDSLFPVYSSHGYFIKLLVQKLKSNLLLIIKSTLLEYQTHSYIWLSLLSQTAYCQPRQTTTVDYRVFGASEWH